MGVTMWVQMKLNPPPPDPTQAMIFNWMPIIFTFMLGSFPAGLVIYWGWNNLLSVTQQWFIMKRHGAEVDLLGNIAASFKRKPQAGWKEAGRRQGELRLATSAEISRPRIERCAAFADGVFGGL